MNELRLLCGRYYKANVCSNLFERPKNERRKNMVRPNDEFSLTVSEHKKTCLTFARISFTITLPSFCLGRMVFACIDCVD